MGYLALLCFCFFIDFQFLCIFLFFFWHCPKRSKRSRKLQSLRGIFRAASYFWIDITFVECSHSNLTDKATLRQHGLRQEALSLQPFLQQKKQQLHQQNLHNKSKRQNKSKPNVRQTITSLINGIIQDSGLVGNHPGQDGKGDLQYFIADPK